jgi:hypothetical protein
VQRNTAMLTRKFVTKKIVMRNTVARSVERGREEKR